MSKEYTPLQERLNGCSTEGKQIAPDPFGALIGTVTIHDPAALTAPCGEHWQAESEAKVGNRD